MKKIIKMLAITSLSLTLVACGQKQAEVEETPIPIPVEIEGNYYEKSAGRGELIISNIDGNQADVLINWPNGAFESLSWSLHVFYDGEALEYTDGVETKLTFSDDGLKAETEEVYNDGTGYFEIIEDGIIWYNNKGEQGDEPSTFLRDYARNEEANMPNPWTETTDLDEAKSISGVEFDPPVGVSVPEGMNFFKYRAMPSVIEALYESVNDELVVRKSNQLSGKELIGDFNTYTKAWDTSVKGLTVHCEGDGETANLAYFDVGDVHFGVSFNTGFEGRGITMDQLHSLINGMQ